MDLAGGELTGSDGNGTVTVETNLVLTSSASEINYGDSVSFTAAVSPVNSAYSGYGAPSGSVNFYDETTGVPLGTVTAFSDNGDGTYTATLPAVSGLDAEDHCILAIYSGDATFVASTSDLTTDVTVDPASTSVTVTANRSRPGVNSAPLTLTASVNATNAALTVPGGDSGTVEFYDQTAGNDLGAAL